MRSNLLSKMTEITLVDREGKDVKVQVRVLEAESQHHVFLSDHKPHEGGSVARNGALFIRQLVDRLELAPEATAFYRHIYSPEIGSVFGRFNVDWQGSKVGSYTFTMLNNVSEEHQVKALVSSAKPVPLKYSQMKNIKLAV